MDRNFLKFLYINIFDLIIKLLLQVSKPLSIIHKVKIERQIYINNSEFIMFKLILPLKMINHEKVVNAQVKKKIII